MSEPIFEASVRLRADVGDFEAQAKASLQRTTQQLEQSAAQAQARVQQTLVGGPVGAGPNAALEQQLAQARQLASQPLAIEVVANTEPFERDVNVAYQKAQVLAEQNVAQLEKVAVEASKTTRAATTSLLQASGFKAREEAQAALTTAQAAERAASQAVSDARLQLSQIRNEAQDALLRPSETFRSQAVTAGTRAETAGLLGNQAEQEAQLLQQEIAGRQFALEQLKLQQSEFVSGIAATSGLEREELVALAEKTAASAGILQKEILELQATGRLAAAPGAPPGAPPGTPPGGGGFFDSITGPGGLLRSRSGSSSLAGILGTTARFGLAGLAFSAVFSGLSELQKALTKTGDAAFTMEGRISNAGASLLTGNFIGAIRALTAAQKAEFVGDLGEKLTAQLEKVRAAENPLVVTEEKLALVREKGRDVLQGYIATLLSQGHITAAQAVGLLKVSDATEKQTKITEAAADAWAEYSLQVEKAGGSLARAFGPDSAGGPRGPGAFPTSPTGAPAGTVIGQQRTGIPRPIIAVGPNPAFEAGTGGQDVANQIRESLIARIQNEGERLQAELKSARLIREQKQAAFDTAKEAAEAAGGGEKAAAAYRDLVLATTNVKNAAAAVAANAQANAEAIAAAGATARDARAARIEDPTARLNAQLANAQQDETTAKATLDRLKSAGKSAREIAEAEASYEQAVTDRVSIEQQISANAKAAAQAAADDARNARELRLANNIAAAALTATKADDKRYYNEAIDYYRSVARDGSRTATEREQARGTVRELQQGLKDALAGGGPQLELQLLQNRLAQAQQVGSIPLQRRAAQRLIDFWEGQVRAATGIERAQAQASLIGARGQLRAANQAAIDLAELRIQNRAQAAKLTEGLGDDQRAADDLIKFWQNQVKHATGLEKERARSQLISARLAKQGLEDVEHTTTVFDLLTDTANRFAQFAGNLRDNNNPFTQQSFTGEVAQFFKPNITPEDLFAGPTGFTADLNAFRERNDRLSKIPGSGVEATDRNTAAINRLTDTLTGRVVPGIERGDAGRTPGRAPTAAEIAGLRGEAMGRFWKARQARLATESGVGAAGAGF